jgi:hypothetical protein
MIEYNLIFFQVHLNVLDHHTIVSILEKIYGTKLMHSDSLQLDEVVEFTLSHCDKYKTDMNLRDILRWVDVTVKLKCEVSEHFSLIFSDRSPSLKKIHNKASLFYFDFFMLSHLLITLLYKLLFYFYLAIQ